MPQVNHNRLPVFTSWASKQCDKRSLEILEINDIFINLFSEVHISEKKPWQARQDKEEKKDKADNIH